MIRESTQPTKPRGRPRKSAPPPPTRRRGFHLSPEPESTPTPPLVNGQQDDRDDDTILWGARAIANELGVPLRRIQHALIKGYLPAKKIGVCWTASRKRLRSFWQEASEG